MPALERPHRSGTILAARRLPQAGLHGGDRGHESGCAACRASAAAAKSTRTRYLRFPGRHAS
jgi:hypothetical protein